MKRDIEWSHMENNNPYLIPISILLAGAMIGGALYFREAPNSKAKDQKVASEQVEENKVGEVKPVTAADHILGDPNAPVKLIEFADLECPFCKRFHTTLKQLMDEFGKEGKLAVVYRHFPLDSIHTKARKEAQAIECAATLGGNAKFWEYVDEIFKITPSNDRLDLAELPKIATRVGLNETSFEECLAAGKDKDKIENQLQDAIRSGGQGTPWSIVVNKAGKKFPINGALPYETVKAIIEEALK